MTAEVMNPNRPVRRVMTLGRSILLICFGAVVTAAAQDSMRLALENDRAAEERQQLLLKDQPFTIRWGELNVLASVSLAAGWNDNVNLSHSNPQEDGFVLPVGNLNLFWPVTEVNALTFSIGVGYEKFLRHDQYDQLWIMPGSLLGWDIVIKDFKINLHDFVSFDQDPTSAGAVSGLGRFGALDNTAGFAVNWDLHDAALSLGYDHQNVFYTPSSFDYLDHASDFAFVRGSFQVHPAVKAGLEANGGPTSYARRSTRDNVTGSAGVFAEWSASEHIQVRARAGYYDYRFDNLAPPAGSWDRDGFYFSLRLTHELREDLNYALTGGRQTYLGIYSPLTEEWYAKVSINWRASDYLTVSPGFKYEHATQPGVAGITDDYDRVSAMLRLSCPLREDLTARLEYQYWSKNDEVASSRDYQQNRITLEFTYRF